MKRFFKSVFVIFFALSLLFVLVSKFQLAMENTDNSCVDRKLFGNRNNIIKLHWRDLQNQSYCLSYQVSHKEDERSEKFRNESLVRAYSYDSYWGEVYKILYENDRHRMDFLYEKIDSIQESDQLSRDRFAEMVVTFVQDIPYTLILDLENCEDRPQYAIQGNCVDEQKYGLLSPIEFLHDTTGDCDTRALLLYTLLKYYGFSPMIMISVEYEHAVLALDITARGDHVKKHGKKYYMWETTGKGWPPGMLPPDSKDMNYWKIALD